MTKARRVLKARLSQALSELKYILGCTWPIYAFLVGILASSYPEILINLPTATAGMYAMYVGTDFILFKLTFLMLIWGIVLHKNHFNLGKGIVFAAYLLPLSPILHLMLTLEGIVFLTKIIISITLIIFTLLTARLLATLTVGVKEP